MAYLLKRSGAGDLEDYKIFTPYSWTHMCMAVDSKTTMVRVAKDGNFTTAYRKFDQISGLRAGGIPKFVFSLTKLGRCVDDWQDSCSVHGIKIADFNVWDYGLSDEQMLDWTGCKWVRLQSYPS